MTSRLAYSRMLDALEAQVGLVRYALAGDGLGTGAHVPRRYRPAATTGRGDACEFPCPRRPGYRPPGAAR